MTRASDLAKLLGAGATINDGTTITTADNTSQLILQSTDADATRGPTLTMQRDSSSPADNDVAGQIFFNADNDAAEDTTYADVFVKLTDVSNGTEDASISFRQISNGSLKEVVMQNGNVDFGDGSGIRLGDGQDFQVYHDGTDNHINVTNAQTLNIQTSGNNAIVVDANGHITKPLQPAFMVRSNQTQSNFTTGSFVTVNFHSERFDQNSDFDNTNMVFTAPVTGRYQFNILITPLEMDSAANYFQVIFDASNVVLQAGLVDSDTVLNSDSAYFMFSGSTLIDMDAGDTCKIKVYQSGGTAQSDLGNGSATFSGYLVC